MPSFDRGGRLIFPVSFWSFQLIAVGWFAIPVVAVAPRFIEVRRF